MAQYAQRGWPRAAAALGTALLLASLAAMLWAGGLASAARPLQRWPLHPADRQGVHVAFPTDCSAYFDWQALGLAFSFRESGQPGQLTRVMSCHASEAATFSRRMLAAVRTHVAPNMTIHPLTHDDYAAYNKPTAIIHWLRRVTPAQQWVLLLDGDMLLRQPFLPRNFGLSSRGWAVASRYDYMIGVDNELADRHIPEVARRNDMLAGPVGRRADRVGAPYLIHRADLKAMAPLWLRYTAAVRQDPEAWHLSGDAFSTQPGDRPWISEMYGYSFGAAKAGVWHHDDHEGGNLMMYPGFEPDGIPRVLHYGLQFSVTHATGTWSWAKFYYTEFDVHKCPPWELSVEHPQAGLFPPPPGPDGLLANLSRGERHRDLISISVVHTLNAALCEFHLRHCPPSEQLARECAKASVLYKATQTALHALEQSLSEPQSPTALAHDAHNAQPTGHDAGAQHAHAAAEESHHHEEAADDHDHDEDGSHPHDDSDVGGMDECEL